MTQEIKKVSVDEATDQMEAVEKLLGVRAENTGGNVMCFVFYGSDNGKKPGVDLFFGYANVPLGYCLYDNDEGQPVKTDDMPADADHSAANQAEYIRKISAELGYKIAETKAA